MQTSKFLSLVKQLIGKDIITEVDSPSDFSMGSNTGSTTSSTKSNTSVGPNTTTSSTVSTTNTVNSSDSDTSNSDMSNFSSFDDSTVDLGLDTSSFGGAGLTPSYDTSDDDNPVNDQNIDPAAPKFRILDVIFDEDDDLNTKVKIQDIETGKTEIKRLDEIII